MNRLSDTFASHLKHSVDVGGLLNNNRGEIQIVFFFLFLQFHVSDFWLINIKSLCSFWSEAERRQMERVHLHLCLKRGKYLHKLPETPNLWA